MTPLEAPLTRQPSTTVRPSIALTDVSASVGSDLPTASLLSTVATVYLPATVLVKGLVSLTLVSSTLVSSALVSSALVSSASVSSASVSSTLVSSTLVSSTLVSSALVSSTLVSSTFLVSSAAAGAGSGAGSAAGASLVLPSSDPVITASAVPVSSAAALSCVVIAGSPSDLRSRPAASA